MAEKSVVIGPVHSSISIQQPNGPVYVYSRTHRKQVYSQASPRGPVDWIAVLTEFSLMDWATKEN
jgi:hypothetical protein